MLLMLNRKVSTALVGLVLLACSTNCGWKSEANLSAHFPFAHVEIDCGPTDNIALYFHFTAKPAECKKYEKPYISIMIDGYSPKTSPHDYSIGSKGSFVSAWRCMETGPCQPATSGNLHTEKIEENKTALGECELHFKDGSVEKGRFDATWCITPPLGCG